jgi:flagellar biosynthesis protein FlhA
VVFTAAELIARQVEMVFRQHAPELLGRVEVQQLLNTLTRSHPGLVEDVTPRHLPLTSVQAVLQQLIAENVSIRETRTLFETLAARAPKSQAIDDLVETVRAALGRSIVDRLFEGSNTLQVIGLAAATETRLLNEMGDEGEALLSPATLDALNDAAERALAEQEGAGYPPVLLTSPGLRAMLARLLRRNLPRLSKNIRLKRKPTSTGWRRCSPFWMKNHRLKNVTPWKACSQKRRALWKILIKER